MGFRVYTELLSVLLICAYNFSSSASGLDTLTASEQIKDLDTLTSKSNSFTLGFFSHENSSNRYLGIWYMLKTTVIWVANRNEPLTDSSGILKISENGNLVVLDGKEHVVWSSDGSDSDTSQVILELQDSGNLVLQNNITGKIIWQSFQHLSDTLLQHINGGSKTQASQKFMLTSWKSPSDPSMGSFTSSMEPSTVPQPFIWNNSRPHWRGGPWNGQVFIGTPILWNQYLSRLTLREINGSFYFDFEYTNLSPLTFFVLNSEGKMVYTIWDDRRKEWVPQWTLQQSDCDIYGICGLFGSCDPQRKPICSCLRGFQPRNAEEWNKGNWTSGCVRRKQLKCERVKNETRNGDEEEEDGFVPLEKTKVPDHLNWTSTLLALPDCRIQCLNSCSCLAYAYDDGIGCMMWSESLIDIERFSSGGVNLYLRLANSELTKVKRKLPVIISIPVTIGTILIAACTYAIWRRSAKHQEEPLTKAENDISAEMLKELPLFEFEKLAAATNNFHSANKIGQGGFGPVYKGKLKDGQEIAVKRLSSVTGQGLEEFMTEVVVISKLQHRNLVRLLGCCVERGEKMLIYEYMPNESLAAYLFDPFKHDALDWQKRYHIIEGIARGLLYLHRDSRLRIIHRDLKASNILLDKELNAKISDFGIAKIFGVSKDKCHTRRVVGTFGYMPPEYAIQGIFSEKSDVFSFGVLLLEIISGRKNTSFYNDQQALSLLGFAWKLWNEENILPLIDPKIDNPQFEKDMTKCIHIGLLCVQELAKDRPTMDSMILTLHNKILNLPFPKQPAFIQWQAACAEGCQNKHTSSSNCYVTMTDIEGR